MKKTLLPAVALLSLSACASLWHREGVGFTGIDGEPHTIPEQTGANYVARRESVPAELAGIPPVRVRADGGDLGALAGVAIANGGQTPASAVEVGRGNQTLLLSTVEVNSVLFAVLRAPEGGAGLEPEAGSAFVASIPRLTGCLASGSVYQSGSREKTKGLAVPLNCS